jgi:cytidyltransferase-like protein
MKIVLVTGGFDPLHSGHIEYFNAAKELGDKLVVGLNSDSWLERKKGRAFMPWNERATIISALHNVDRVINFNDDDNSATDAIRKVKELFENHSIIFANGGDRNAGNIPEMLIPDVLFKFGIGGANKANSSSWILDEWKAPKTERPWGYYRVLHEVPGMKVKELTINPGEQLSMQRHNLRSEFWIISEGKAILNSRMPGGYSLPALKPVTHASYTIPKQDWHQLTNPFDIPCRIVEIQYGESCIEDDIERQN